MKKKLIYLSAVAVILFLIFQMVGSVLAMPADPEKEMILAYLKAEGKLESHTHGKTVFFDDDGVRWGYCCECGMILSEKDAPRSAKTVYKKTGAALRLRCDHSFDCYTLGATQHHVICSGCGYSYVEAHSIIPASCTQSEHCSSCGHREPSWEDAYGHSMGYVCDYLGGTHTLRCLRMDDDGAYICDHIEIDGAACTWGDEYVDPPYYNSNEHYIWQDCTICGNFNFVGSYPCRLPDICLYPH